MNFDLSDEQKMLAEQVRALLADRSPYDRLRQLIDAGEEWDEDLWRELGSLGFLGAAIPESSGGLGLGQLDLGVISEELGRANAAVPFFSSLVLAATAISLAGSEEQQSRWLPRLAAGTSVGCFAYSEGPGWRAPQLFVDHGRLTGCKTPVADAGVADIAVIACCDSLALVELKQPGVVCTRLESFDELRPHYRIEFDAAVAETLPGGDVLEALFDRAAVQSAFEGVGGADACLYMARDYAAQRRIFGRPLASYQAIKHKLADIVTAVELARSNAYFGAWAADAAPHEVPAAAAAARLSAIAAFELAARENLHVHGGIGYTFEANCHFYYRRERLLAAALGGRERWVERLLAHDAGSPLRRP